MNIDTCYVGGDVMKVISVINYKGGVGKTTLTANLAAELASKGRKVLAIDLDPQSNLTFSFVKVDEWQEKYSENKTIKSWFEEFIEKDNNSDIKELTIKPPYLNSKSKENLDLICSHLGLINVDLELATILNSTTDKENISLERKLRNNSLKVYSLLKNSIKDFEDDYDIVLIDCPPNFNIVTKNAIVASDYYLVPVKPDYLSTLAVEQINHHIDDLKENYNRDLVKVKGESCDKINSKFLGVVCNMVNKHKSGFIKAQEEYICQLERNSICIFDTKIRESNTKFGQAPQSGIPLVMSSAKTDNELVLELKNLAAELEYRMLNYEK